MSLGSEGDPQPSCVDFSLFYVRRGDPKVSHASNHRTLVVPQLPSAWTEIADQSTEDAENLFWDAIKMLDRYESGEIESFWPPVQTADETSSDEM